MVEEQSASISDVLGSSCSKIDEHPFPVLNTKAETKKVDEQPFPVLNRNEQVKLPRSLQIGRDCKCKSLD